jgi:hypothetical protein
MRSSTVRVEGGVKEATQDEADEGADEGEVVGVVSELECAVV